MKLKIKVSFSLLLITSFAQSTDSLNQFYSTFFFAKYRTARKTLKENGFKELYFKTSDNLQLNGLLLERPHARCNVIICAGWLPGKMEGMANFFELLPNDCNILFFDSRGHAKSEGPLWKNVWRYGVNEYKDIIGAITFTNKINSLPIIICGVCSGAFNAAHALITLEKFNLTEKLKIKGLIFDSGWGSVTKMSYTNGLGNIEKALVMSLASLYKTKNLLKQSFLYNLLCICTQSLYKIVHYTCIKPLITQYENITTLFDKIHHITSPILFVHGHNDNVAYIEDAITLSTLTKNKKCWWIEYSSHAAHHIKHAQLYKEKLTAFIDTCLQ